MLNKENIFAKKDDVADFIKENLSISAQMLNKCIEKGINSSDLTRCNRYLYYKYISGIPYKMEQIVKEAVVKKWGKIFSVNKLFDIVTTSYACADIKYNIVGTIDLIVKIIDNPRKPLAVMFKRKNAEDINDGKISRKDIVEIMANMWMAEIADGILIYENEQDTNIEVFHVVPDTYLINSIKSTCKDIFTVVKKIPDRPYGNVSEECEKCYFKEFCWK